MTNEQLELNIAVANNRKATTWKNTRVTWEWLRDRLQRVKRSGETLEEYLAWPKDRQDDAKDAGGFVGGFLVDGTRRRGHVKYRQVLALDVDNDKPGLPAWEAFKARHAGVAALLYSTRKHRPAAPRYRVVIPLDREVTPDEYQAIGRAVAGRCGIDAFDDSTYDATRLMYWPTACADGEVLFEEVEGDPLPADGALAWLADWRDCSTWPRSSRERGAGKTPGNREGSTVADPRGKGGVVGAFCRCYTVPGVIENFLLETYDPVEGRPDRYTFCGASTSGGLVVYDEVLAYSHHATDPAGGRLLNAFDLARIHLHGHLDARWDDSRPVTTAPSFAAMVDIVGNLPNVKREVLRELQEGFLQACQDDEDEEGEDDDSWKEELETAGKRGRVLPTIANASLILARDPRLKGRFGFDRFARRELIMKRPPWDEKGVEHYPRDRRDNDEVSLRAYIEANYKLQGRGAVSDALALAFQAGGFHPLRAYLDKLQWDGVERVDTLFVRLFGASDTPYTRAVTRKIMCAAIARAYRPGRHFDYMVVLLGPQGVGKSKTIERLGGPWYTDRVTMTGGKETIEQLRGAWICEWGEMRGIRVAEYEALKLFISSPVDRYRPAYGHVVEAFPRQCVFFATTNEETPLTDPTGGRRFWIVNCLKSEGSENWYDYLTRETVNQLWAEAKARYHQGEKLYLDPELEKEARRVQEEHREQDSWSSIVEEYLANTGIDHVSVRDIWEKALLVDKPVDWQSQRRIGNVMKNIEGWKRGRYRTGKGKRAPAEMGWVKVKEAEK
jgi:predicted P-loop ATPase